MEDLDFDKLDGLIPAIIQDNETDKVLMLGFMNKEAYKKTLELKKVTFYSRTRKCLWTKGETSGNFLNVVSILVDCDRDTLLIKVNPVGPVCHTGADTCWNEVNKKRENSLAEIESILKNLKKIEPSTLSSNNKSASIENVQNCIDNIFSYLKSNGVGDSIDEKLEKCVNTIKKELNSDK